MKLLNSAFFVALTALVSTSAFADNDLGEMKVTWFQPVSWRPVTAKIPGVVIDGKTVSASVDGVIVGGKPDEKFAVDMVVTDPASVLADYCERPDLLVDTPLVFIAPNALVTAVMGHGKPTKVTGISYGVHIDSMAVNGDIVSSDEERFYKCPGN